MSILFAAVFSVDAILAALTARDWRTLLSNMEIITTLGIDIVMDLRDATLATAVSKNVGLMT